MPRRSNARISPVLGFIVTAPIILALPMIFKAIKFAALLVLICIGIAILIKLVGILHDVWKTLKKFQ